MSKPIGIKTFQNNLCKNCECKTSDCGLRIDLCILAEINYNIKRLSVIVENALKKRHENLEEMFLGGRE